MELFFLCSSRSCNYYLYFICFIMLHLDNCFIVFAVEIVNLKKLRKSINEMKWSVGTLSGKIKSNLFMRRVIQLLACRCWLFWMLHGDDNIIIHLGKAFIIDMHLIITATTAGVSVLRVRSGVRVRSDTWLVALSGPWTCWSFLSHPS